jgi:hypothetical protein
MLNEILNKVLQSTNGNKDDTKPTINTFDNVNDVFKLPIMYNDKATKISETIVNDLELLTVINGNDKTDGNDKPIYNYVFTPTNTLGNKVINALTQYYTTDTHFLKENQQLVETFSNKTTNEIAEKHKINNFEIEETVSAWNEIKSETGFCEKYLYIDWDFAKSMNNNPQFLQILSLYNITSPILSLSLPILVLIVPFFIIKLKGIELNMREYTDILRGLISEHAITKIFTSFHEVDTGQKIYLLISAALYMLSIYQNILICIRFYSNMKKIHDYISKFSGYINYTLDSMEYHLEISKPFTSYTKFNEDLMIQKNALEKLKSNIDEISPLRLSIFKIYEIGDIMHTFYQIYDNSEYNEAMLYSFGFNGYNNLISGLKKNIEEFKLNKTTFIKEKPEKQKKHKKHNGGKHVKPIFEKMYYPKFINDEKVVSNDCKLDKNIIITGPNASGKTTVLKSAFINILLSQQIGFGCFASLKMKPYEHFHCYLNIPDTSGRDSLFQAEARRCKEIIDSIANTNDTEDTHFCIFDELYSGTNPEEAVTSASAFMKYIIKSDNVTCLLTTHYVKLCHKLSKNKKILNCNMDTNIVGTNIVGQDFEYTYKLVNGISTVKGGLKVLSDMNYPNEIIHFCRTDK